MVQTGSALSTCRLCFTELFCIQNTTLLSQLSQTIIPQTYLSRVSGTISLHHRFWIGQGLTHVQPLLPKEVRCWPAMAGHITHQEKGIKPRPLETERKMVLAQKEMGIQSAEDRWLDNREPKQHAVGFGRKEQFHGYPWHLIPHKQLKD